MHPAVVVLVIASALLGLLALVCAVFDLRAVATRIGQYKATGTVLHLQANGAAHAVGSVAATSEAAPLDQRVAQIESRLATVESEQKAAKVVFDEALRTTAADLDNENQQRIRALARLVAPPDRPWWRTWAPVLAGAAAIITGCIASLLTA